MNALLNAIWDRINGEPAVVLGLVNAAIGLAVSFGLHWTPEQIGATMAFTSVLLAFLTRRQVIPTSALIAK